MLIETGVKIMESQLLWEFISFLKARWPARSRVDQRRRRLRQLVAMVRAVADAAECRAGAGVRDGTLSAWLQVLRAEALRGQEALEAPGCDATAVAGSARGFLAGLRALLVRSAEVDRLTEAVDELEHLAGDLELFVKVLRLDPAARVAAMEVDGGDGARDRRGERSSSGTSSVVATCAGLELTAPAGGKRKRGASSSGADEDSASHGQVDSTTVQLPKRRALASMRPLRRLQSFPAGSAPRHPPPPLPVSRSRRARAVAMAMSRIRHRGKPTTTRRREQRRSLDQQLSRISL